MADVAPVEGERAPSGSGARRWRRAIAVPAVVDVVVLVTSGMWLTFGYRPTNPFRLTEDPVRLLHRWSAGGFVALAVLALVLALLRSVQAPTGRAAPVVLAALGVLGAGAAWWTGSRLPWDQLALWAVRVGTDMRGYAVLWDDEVRFVLAGGREVDTGSMQRLLLIHALVLPVLMGLALLVAARRWQRARTWA